MPVKNAGTFLIKIFRENDYVISIAHNFPIVWYVNFYMLYNQSIAL